MSVILKREKVIPDDIILKKRKTNCYILYIESKKGYIIDPGGEGQKIIQKIKEFDITPIAIILTHGHFDHWLAIDELRDEYGYIPIWMNEKDIRGFNDSYKECMKEFNNAVEFGNKVSLKRLLKRIEKIKNYGVDRLLKEGDPIKLNGVKFEVIETSGHTDGSISLYTQNPVIFKEIPYKEILICGDFLFKDGFANTTIDGADEELYYTNLKQKLLFNHDLNSTLMIFPGHRNEMTLGEFKHMLYKRLIGKDYNKLP